MTVPLVVATLRGRPRAMPAGPGARAAWTSSFVREEVPELELEREGPRGNVQVDAINHGGVDKAVLAYAAAHYPRWRVELGRDDLGWGAWGENLVVEDLDEETVCIGDRYRIGDAAVEVSQPRQPCWKLGARWAMPELARRTIETARTGWYLRVVEPGLVRAGDPVVLVARIHPDWSVARATGVFFEGAPEERRRLAGIPVLAAAWRSSLSARS